MTGQTPALDKVLSSSGRVRILSLLAEVEEIHLSEIARRTEQSYSATERHLRDLAGSGMVEEKDYGRVRIFRLKTNNPCARMLRDLILQWNNDPGREPGRAQP